MIIGSITIILLGIVFMIIKPSGDWQDTGMALFVIAVLMLLSGIAGISVTILSKDRVKRLTKGETSITPEAFLKLRKKYEIPVFKGVYILHNRTQNKYYVGQGINVAARINQHFSGKGNGDVYADWKYGNRFRIRIIPLKGSRYRTLDELEKHAISKYDAFSKGYNKTRGNS
ncbi:MAG: GIY-YIG nuclease family protein [Parasporobacterium sp.]|nr:GIY-YIG nuclease family protein [Parasporobacterium sp.]